MIIGPGFTQPITRIKGLSERRRLPRIDKIRLGVKIRKGQKEYPAELPFLLLPPGVSKTFGGKITVDRAKELGVTRQDILSFIDLNKHRLAEEIEIMFPLNDTEIIFPQALTWYGSLRGVKCRGDGERALRTIDEGKAVLQEITCPCENLKTDDNPKGECTHRGHLLYLIPKVTTGGVYQTDFSGYHSIVSINSCLDYVERMVGRIALVPLTLRRVPIETHHGGQKQIHFILQALLQVPIDQLEALRKDTGRILMHQQPMLIEMDDLNPAFDEADIVQVEPEANSEESHISEDRIEVKALFEDIARKKEALIAVGKGNEYSILRNKYPNAMQMTIDQLAAFNVELDKLLVEAKNEDK